jgi:tRNA-dihydrouridine synthase
MNKWGRKVEKMKDLITAIAGRVLDKREQKKKDRFDGIGIINSLLDDIENGLNMIKNEQNGHLPKESWEKEKTFPYGVKSIISEIYKKNKSKAYPFDEIKEGCKHYFEEIIKNWGIILGHKMSYGTMQEALKHPKVDVDWQNFQKDKETIQKVIDMLKQTKSLLEKNSI